MDLQFLVCIAYRDGYDRGIAGQHIINRWKSKDASIAFAQGYEDGAADKEHIMYEALNKMVQRKLKQQGLV